MNSGYQDIPRNSKRICKPLTRIIIHTRAGPANNRNLILKAQSKFLYSFETVDTKYLVHYDIDVTEPFSTGHSHFS